MSELAKFTIRHELSGMKVPGEPEGVGNRRLIFEYDLDPTDLEGATKAWYAHLEPWFGKEEAERMLARVMPLEK